MTVDFGDLNVEVHEMLVDDRALVNAGIGRIQHIVKCFYICETGHSLLTRIGSLGNSTDDGSIADVYKDNLLRTLSKQQISVLFFMKDFEWSNYIDWSCRYIHRDLNCHITNKLVYEEFMIHSSLARPSEVELADRIQFVSQLSRNSPEWRTVIIDDY
jgi:hypothetical protein